MDIKGCSANVLVNGRKVKEYRHNGLTFIEAKNGTEFAIEVKNHGYGRVLAIVSVDGLDIVDGKPATGKSRGYIIDSNNAETLHGYRRNSDQVANFKFTTSEGSYATDKGRGQNNGIIAVKFVAEGAKPWTPRKQLPQPRWPHFPTPYYTLDNTGSYGGGGTTMRSSMPMATARGYSAKGTAMAAVPSFANGGECVMRESSAQAYSLNVINDAPTEAAFDMGTTWGSVREEKVTESPFIYGRELGTIEFYYASREALKAMGVKLITQKAVPALPQAFEGQFATPPSNWRA